MSMRGRSEPFHFGRYLFYMSSESNNRIISSPLPWPVSSHIYLIAEIGINHNGSLDVAKELIAVARDAGCDAVKFQKREPDVCVSERQKAEMRDTPWGRMTYLEYKHRIEFGRAEFDEIDKFCRQLGIPWSASAWDVQSQDFLRSYDRPFNKVASAMTTDVEFLHHVAKDGLFTFISTGMCTMHDIEVAVEVFSSYNTPFELMHSVSTYPAASEHLNLATILTLRQHFGVAVGYSGHEPSVSPSIVAGALGATSIERHITLDRSMWGTDQAASLEPTGLRQLVGALRKLPVEIGDGEKRVLAEEWLIAQKLRRS